MSVRDGRGLRGLSPCPAPPPACLTLAPEDEAAVPSLPSHMVKAQERGIYPQVLPTLPHFVGVTGADLGDQGH